MPNLLHYEDFPLGREFPLGPHLVTAEEIISFAREFDPQRFHLDDRHAKSSVLGGLSASGWHSCAMLMRMLCDSYLNRAASLGSPGIDEVKWLKPVRTGDILSGTMTVIERRVSSKRPDLGILKCRWDIFNKHAEKKIEQVGIHFIKVSQP